MVITAKIIADSIAGGVRLTTLQLRAPKFLDAEFEKHRMISSNSSSDRAVPFNKLCDQADFLPPKVYLNQPGMQGEQLMSDDEVAEFHQALIDIQGYTKEVLAKWNHVHKQHLNRYLLGFSWQNKIASATEFTNFFNLRLHPDAQPEIQELAKVMKAAMDESSPRVLVPGEWHLPYVNEEIPFGAFFAEVDIGNAGLVSAARCARISFLNHDQSEPDAEKDLTLAKKLLAAGHMSPFEHQAKPLWNTSPHAPGVTHFDPRDESLWSGNFRGWIQHRQIL
jgi:thymidylate synthase ThyX